MDILGLAISGAVALTLAIVGLWGLIGKGSIGNSIRSFLGMIPIGSPKLWAAVVLAIGLLAGGFVYGQDLVSGWIGGNAQSATVTAEEAVNVGGPVLTNCQITTISATTAVVVGNLTMRADPNDLTHYYVDVKNTTNGGAGSINGTVVCDRVIDNIRIGQSATCEIVSDSFKSQTSTTDSNTYYFVATSTTKSRVAGMPWAQTAYLNSGAVATTASRQEVSPYTFAQDAKTQTLGFIFTLPGATTLNYLNDNNGGNIKISCDGKQVAYLTVNKLAAQVI